MGNLRQLQKQYGEAEKSYRKALDVDPTNSDALNGLMTVYLVQKDPTRRSLPPIRKSPRFPTAARFTIFWARRFSTPRKTTRLPRLPCASPPNSTRKLGRGVQARTSILQSEGSLRPGPSATYQQSGEGTIRGEISFYILLGEMYETKTRLDQANNLYQESIADSV